MAEIKSESVADFIPESLADLLRNTHAEPLLAPSMRSRRAQTRHATWREVPVGSGRPVCANVLLLSLARDGGQMLLANSDRDIDLRIAYSLQSCTHVETRMNSTKGSPLKDILKRILHLPANAIIASSTNVWETPYLADKFYPYRANQKSFIRLKSEERGRAQGEFPIPPDHLHLQTFGATFGVGSENAPTDRNKRELFLNQGKDHVSNMQQILSKSGFRIQDANRILDFGCGPGRMIRWLNELAERCEIWGVDISAVQILWCQQYLSPPFKFFTITTAPHLPFEDNIFDLIYCGSVFTHIDDLADAWLLELRRILRPGGRLYITIADKHFVQLVLKVENWIFADALRQFEKNENISETDFNMFTMGRGHRSHVIYDIDYLKHHWGQFLKVLSVTEEAFDEQTAMVLEK